MHTSLHLSQINRSTLFLFCSETDAYDQYTSLFTKKTRKQKTNKNEKKLNTKYQQYICMSLFFSYRPRCMI